MPFMIVSFETTTLASLSRMIRNGSNDGIQLVSEFKGRWLMFQHSVIDLNFFDLLFMRLIIFPSILRKEI